MNAERAFSCVKGAVDIKDIQNCRPPRLHTAMKLMPVFSPHQARWFSCTPTARNRLKSSHPYRE
nr:MAG TPA: hypothetical protein [Caudoviricetes sp.]